MAVEPPGAVFDWFAAALSSGLGLVGRLMYLSQERRQPLSWSLAWELPIAIGMGMIGRAVGEYANLGGFMLFSASIVSGYMGPRMVSWAVSAWTKRNPGFGS